MKRTLYKRAGLWELSVPLRAPVRGIWRYATFAEAWGHLWRAGYPPGLPGEIKTAVRSAETSPLGVEYLADIDDAVAAVKEFVPDVLLPADEPKPHASSWKSRAIAVGLGIGLTILLVTLVWPFSHGGSGARPSIAESTIPNAAAPATKPVEAPPPLSGTGKSRAFIRTTDRSWITACVDDKIAFSKLFTRGSQESVDFVDRAVLRLGDAGPVEITLDGKSVGPLGGPGQVRVIELDRGESHFLVGGEVDDCALNKSK